MKTITVPGKTTSIGVRLTPAKATALQCAQPTGLLACNGVEWASAITLIKDF